MIYTIQEVILIIQIDHNKLSLASSVLKYPRSVFKSVFFLGTNGRIREKVQLISSATRFTPINPIIIHNNIPMFMFRTSNLYRTPPCLIWLNAISVRCGSNRNYKAFDRTFNNRVFHCFATENQKIHSLLKF